jgi:dual specificity protein kinase YAK1
MVNANIASRNRYLILDVLGQGTFGQVVKCQNLKTQEVVAVKVVKNRTAYFNQSMMEVSVLDLVCTIRRNAQEGMMLISFS